MATPCQARRGSGDCLIPIGIRSRAIGLRNWRYTGWHHTTNGYSHIAHLKILRCIYSKGRAGQTILVTLFMMSRWLPYPPKPCAWRANSPNTNQPHQVNLCTPLAPKEDRGPLCARRVTMWGTEASVSSSHLACIYPRPKPDTKTPQIAMVR